MIDESDLLARQRLHAALVVILGLARCRQLAPSTLLEQIALLAGKALEQS